MKKTILSLICIISTLCISVLSVNAEINPHALYQDLNELIYGNDQRADAGGTDYPRLNGADIIIVGNVISEEQIFLYSGENDENSSPYTLAYVNVTEVIRGNIEAGDIIAIHQFGHKERIPDKNGKFPPIAGISIGAHLKVESNYLMFIHIHKSDVFENFDGIYRPVNQYQGFYELDSNGNLLPYDNISNPVIISSVDEVRKLVAIGNLPKIPDKNADVPAARVPIVTDDYRETVTNAPVSASRSDVPKGGVVIGVIPVILAGAVLIVAKRKLKR